MEQAFCESPRSTGPEGLNGKRRNHMEKDDHSPISWIKGNATLIKLLMENIQQPGQLTIIGSKQKQKTVTSAP